jgi:hypothetical protein
LDCISKKIVLLLANQNFYYINPAETKIHKTPQASSNRQRSVPKTSQNDLPNGCQSGQQDEDSTIQNSISSYPGAMDKIDDAKEEPYVSTVGKAKPGVLRKTYESVKQSKLVKLCRYGLLLKLLENS